MTRPLIGITTDINPADHAPSEACYIVRCNYAAAVERAGGIPVMLGCLCAAEEQYVERLNGFIVTGTAPGVSEQPMRTGFEMALIQTALSQGKPLLGICNGMQLLGRELGARIVDLPEESIHIPHPVPTTPAHVVAIEKGSLLAHLGGGSARVNSLHRQALVGQGDFEISARAEDSVIEAIEGPGFSLGVQWHPEYSLQELDRQIFSALVAASAGRDV